ncbi:MAG: KEOPS complex kinase/ATPase Bud32 [Candidatus Micrarchaeia archaeon]|jgi:Kae1-associated kinase Bud32
MAQKLIAKGAEADVFSGELLGMPAVFKVRKPKAYRINEIDRPLREMRTKKEARLLHQAKSCGALCPAVLRVGEFEIAMERMSGKLMREEKNEGKLAGIAGKAGKLLAQIHEAKITHGDFTPANIMVDAGKVAVIDFGLGEFGSDDEERATDILLMKKSVPKKAYSAFLSAYCKARGQPSKLTLERLDEIELRGRYVARGALA